MLLLLNLFLSELSRQRKKKPCSFLKWFTTLVQKWGQTSLIIPFSRDEVFPPISLYKCMKEKCMEKEPHTLIDKMTGVIFIILNTSAAHEKALEGWREMVSEDHGFAVPRDLQHLSAVRAASSLPISLFGRTGIFPCNCVIFHLCRHFL